MDDLLREFLTETSENLDRIDVQLVRFEQEPTNARILANIFRLVHTIKGTCGFIGLPRLEALSHAAEALMGKFRDGMPATSDAVTLILATIDRLKLILDRLEATQTEPEGSDRDLIDALMVMADGGAMASDSAALAPAPIAPSQGNVLGGRSAAILRDARLWRAPQDEVEWAARDEVELAATIPNPHGEERGTRVSSHEAGHGHAAADPVADPEMRVARQSIRVNVDTLEKLMTMVSELVLTRNQLLDLLRHSEDTEFKAPLQRLSAVTAELQDGVMKTRMQPIGHAWQKLPRLVRDLSAELGKEIELDMSGAETELDRQVIEVIRDPLIHMIRNSADHGLESPGERAAAGKPAKGAIRLSACHEGGHVVIGVADDGRGLDLPAIRRKIVANGLATESGLDAMTDAQIHRFIFTPGFTTAAAVTNVSGRGVGMDVVRSNIEEIGGSIDVKSGTGEGTQFTIKIPLTLAIVPVLIVQTAGERLAIPQTAVVELVRARANSTANSCARIERIKDVQILRLRDRLLPLIDLADVLELRDGRPQSPTEKSKFDVIAGLVPAIPTRGAGTKTPQLCPPKRDGRVSGHRLIRKPLHTFRGDALTGHDVDRDSQVVVVMQVAGQSFGAVVDNVLHTEDIVVKPMASKLRHLSLLAGNTILGDGTVIMILDPNRMMPQTNVLAPGSNAAEHNAAQADAIERTPLLLFRAGSPVQKAAPLSLIARLEKIDTACVEIADGRAMIRYRDRLMPLIEIGGARLRSSGPQPILVVAEGARMMGLVADEIIDIVEEHLQIEIASAHDGMLGSAVIRGQVTEIVDITSFLRAGFSDRFDDKDAGPSTLSRAVLLVDDSAFFRNMLAPVLRDAGYRVSVASHAREALDLLRKEMPFDAVLTDIEMPDIDGFQLAETIRADQRLAGVPILALSSQMSAASVERGRQAGFHGLIAKFDRSGLIAALQEHATLGRAA